MCYIYFVQGKLFESNVSKRYTNTIKLKQNTFADLLLKHLSLDAIVGRSAKWTRRT